MSFTGYISNGQVVLDQPVTLADGTLVRVELVELTTVKPENPKPTMLEHYRRVIGKVELPPDAAEQHDHYLYGSPRR